MSPYTVAEWLSFNRDGIKKIISPYYEQARQLPTEQACEVIYNALCATYWEENPQLPVDVVSEWFDDEKVKMIMDVYYTKEFYNEH